MKVYLVILCSLLFANILSFKYKELTMNKLYNINKKDIELQFFKFPLYKLKVIPSEITIQTESKESSPSSVIGVHYEPIKLENYKDLLKTKVGEPIILNSEFIKSALDKKGEIYFAIFSDKSYHINILPKGEMKYEKKFIQAQPQVPLRGLYQENRGLADISTSSTGNRKTAQYRIQYYAGDGLSALLVAFIMIFIGVIGCLIMMRIYVHTTALVEQPLKLGKVEA